MMTNEEIQNRAEFSSRNGSEFGRSEAAILAEQRRAEAHRAAFDAEWTRERTIERRAKWNAMHVTPATRIAAERKLGFAFANLVAAIKIHAL